MLFEIRIVSTDERPALCAGKHVPTVDFPFMGFPERGLKEGVPKQPQNLKKAETAGGPQALRLVIGGGRGCWGGRRGPPHMAKTCKMCPRTGAALRKAHVRMRPLIDKAGVDKLSGELDQAVDRGLELEGV